MWMFLIMVCLLDQNQATPLPWEHSSLQSILQQQLSQTTPTATPDVRQQKTSSSSSSSSSSASSESSQSSEGPQQLRERQKVENTAVEQMDSSQEAPSNSSSLWLNELVLLGERGGERDSGADSVGNGERRHRALLTFHPLLSRPGLGGRGLAAEEAAGLDGAIGHEGGAITEAGGGGVEVGVAVGLEGGVRGDERDAEFPRLLDDSTESAGGLTMDSPGYAHRHGYHGKKAGLELGL